MTTSETGKRGEETALKYLRRKGYRLITRNYRFGRYEIDLVMQDGDTVVFVEVKARTDTRFGTPAAFVTAQKQRFLIAAAQGFLLEKRLSDASARFDVIEVYLSDGKVRHIVNAFGT